MSYLVLLWQPGKYLCGQWEHSGFQSSSWPSWLFTTDFQNISSAPLTGAEGNSASNRTFLLLWALLQDATEAENLGGSRERIYCSHIHPGISQYKFTVLIVTFIFCSRTGKKHSFSMFQKTLCIWEGYLVINQDTTILYFYLFPEVHPGGSSCRRQNQARWHICLVQFHMSHACGWSCSGSCSGCGERSALWVEPNKPPWALGAAALVQLKTRNGSVKRWTNIPV